MSTPLKVRSVPNDAEPELPVPTVRSRSVPPLPDAKRSIPERLAPVLIVRSDVVDPVMVPVPVAATSAPLLRVSLCPLSASVPDDNVSMPSSVASADNITVPVVLMVRPLRPEPVSSTPVVVLPVAEYQTLYVLSRCSMPLPLALSDPPARVMTEPSPTVRLPAVKLSEPDVRCSASLTVTSAVDDTDAPSEVNASAVISPENVRPDVRPSAKLSTSIVPEPVRLPAVMISAVPVADVRVPFTVSVEVPVIVRSDGRFTVMPDGMITISEDSNDPGIRPPQVSEEPKLPDNTAV